MHKNTFLIIIILFSCWSLAYAGKSPIFYAAETGDIKNLKILIEEGIRVDFKDDKGFTALMLAADTGKLEAVKLLVKHGANINARNIDGETPLLRAANSGHLGVVRFLVEQGADANAYSRNNKASTAYGYAKKNGHSEVANYLKSFTSTTSTSSAARSGGFEIIAGSPKRLGYATHWTAICNEGGSAGAWVHDSMPNIYSWQSSNFERTGSAAGIGVEAALRKACGGE